MDTNFSEKYWTDASEGMYLIEDEPWKSFYEERGLNLKKKILEDTVSK